MLDHLAIVSVAGVILWSWTSPDLDAGSLGLQKLLNALFRDVLLREGASAAAHHDVESSRIKWQRTDRGLVIAAVYNLELESLEDFSYVPKLLRATKSVSPALALHANAARADDFGHCRCWTTPCPSPCRQCCECLACLCRAARVVEVVPSLAEATWRSTGNGTPSARPQRLERGSWSELTGPLISR
jgi:hypothetical protein